MRRTNIFLENPLDPTNVGCIIRDVYAFDAGTLYYPKSFKTSGKTCSLRIYDFRFVTKSSY